MTGATICACLGASRRKKHHKLFSVPLRNSILAQTELTALDESYQELLSDYAKIMNEYKQDQHRSKRQSGFPNRLEWVPKARQMTERERMLLNGPSNSIVLLKRVSVQNDKTGRIITYTSAICETSTSQASSYVALVHHNDSPKQYLEEFNLYFNMTSVPGHTQKKLTQGFGVSVQ